MPGTSFDRVASIYDETRGGEGRGSHFAESLAPWISGPRVIELGIGTGVIANGLRSHRIDVIGVDLSTSMMRRAVDRIGPRVALADVDRLPFADNAADSAYFVWVLHLVHDPSATLTEAARLVRPGGRIATIMNASVHADNDEISPIVDRLAPLRQARPDHNTVATNDHPGLELVHEGFTTWKQYETTPTVEADAIENRVYSSLFDVDDETWRDVVIPVIDALRSLPDPDRPRQRHNRHPLLVWRVSTGASPELDPTRNSERTSR
jgi:SAM-dependent methyltransferase